MELVIGKKSREKLTHFKCGACGKWWTIGDAPSGPKQWFCPWCGVAQQSRLVKSRLSVG